MGRLLHIQLFFSGIHAKKSREIARGPGCYANGFTFLDQTYMDFISTKFQGKQKHVLLFLEPLDDSDLRNPCGCLRADILGLIGECKNTRKPNVLTVGSIVFYFS